MNIADYVSDDILNNAKNEFGVDMKQQTLGRKLYEKFVNGELDEHDIELLMLLSNTSFDDDDGSDEMVDKYADNLRNYLYQYKPEATTVDPSIDPNEEQIGIMAQDLEKVNPACVKTLEDGTKVVDTERLALMNAGVIASLARRIEALEAKLGND